MSEFDKQAYADRVANLRNPALLTAGLELTDLQQGKVDQAIAEVRAKGFSIIAEFITSGRLARVRAAMEPIFAMTTERDASRSGRHSGTQTVHVHNLFAKTDAVDEIAIDPVLLKIIAGVLGEQFQMSVATAMCPDPGVDAQDLHRDDGHYPLARPRPPFIANTLIALDDFSEENGATQLVPGSHLYGDEQPRPSLDEVIYAEMPAGSLLVFDGALWHGGGGNRSQDRRRRSINLNFNLSWLRQQENQYLGIGRERWLGMPERLQRLLGLQKVNFLYGSVDYTDPLVYFKEHME